MQQIKVFDFVQNHDLNENICVIDGSNVVFEQRTSDNKPKLSNLLTLIKNLKQLGITHLKIICDRSLYYCINDKKKYHQLLKKGRIIESPEGNPSDIYILQYALQKNCYIISNDKYRDFHHVFPKKWLEYRRISFRIIDDVFCFNRIIAKGGEKNG